VGKARLLASTFALAIVLALGVSMSASAHTGAGITKHEAAVTLKNLKANGWVWLDKDRNFHRITRLSAAYWGVSYAWMHNCAHSEGLQGHTILWADNYAGAGGPFQYLDGTFSGFSRHAWAAMKARGLRVPVVYRSKGSLVGQALTTGWAFRNGLSFHWYGTGC